MAGGITLPSSKRTLLQMVQNVCNELALTAPTSLFGNSDPQATQFLALAQREGYEFSERPGKNEGWQELRKEYVFNTVGSGLLSGNFTNNSAIVTGITPNTTTIVAGQTAVMYGIIPTGTTVLSVDSSSQITLSTAASFSVGSGTGQSFYTGQEAYPLPTDIDRIMTQTYWDRAFRWQLLGPLDAQEWQVLKSGISPTGPRRRFRIMNNNFFIDPVPSSSGNPEVFEYFTNYWAQSGLTTAGTPKPRFSADGDYYILDDNCMELGLKWRFLAAKRFDYDEERDVYEKACQRAMSSNGANRNLPLNAQSSGQRLLNEQNIPDTGFGS